MADRYLLESGAPDGYLLEDGSGVLLLETGVKCLFNISQFRAGFSQVRAGLQVIEDQIVVALGGGGAVFNSADKDADITLSGGDLTATRAAGTGPSAVRSTNSHSGSGKYYFEVKRSNISTPSSAAIIALATPSYVLTDQAGQVDEESVGFYADGLVWFDGGSSDLSIPIADEEWAGIAFDAATGDIWIRNSSGYAVSGDPAGGTNPSLSGLSALKSWLAAVQLYDGGDEAVANFGGSAFAYTIPSGFTAWG